MERTRGLQQQGRPPQALEAAEGVGIPFVAAAASVGTAAEAEPAAAGGEAPWGQFPPEEAWVGRIGAETLHLQQITSY